MGKTEFEACCNGFLSVNKHYLAVCWSSSEGCVWPLSCVRVSGRNEECRQSATDIGVISSETCEEREGH